MVKFSRKSILLTDVLINSKNPRFDPVTNQPQSIQLMIAEKKSEIKKLAKDILEKGLNPSKNLIMVKKNTKYLTLEGNRRIISLKLLNDPKLSKDKDVYEFFSNLKDDHTDSIPSSVYCVVFEKEEDARHWILLEHTGKNGGVGIDPWNPVQKQRFEHTITKLTQVLDFTDNNKIDRQKVKPSNFDRILSYPYACSTIGISFPKGLLKFDVPISEVKENIKTLFKNMSKSSFSVLTIYNRERLEPWLNEIFDVDNSKQSSTSKVSTKKAKKSTKRKNLIPKNCDLEIEPTKINDIFLELKEDLILEGVKATPNAVGVLFRVFLESSINYYLKKKQIQYSFNTKLKTKINSVSCHMVNIKIATSEDVKYVRNTAQKESSNILSVENFHEYVHSKNIRPVPGDLKAYWDNCQEFFEILWKNV